MDTAERASMTDRKIEGALARTAEDLSTATQALRAEMERYVQAVAESSERQCLIRATGTVA